MFYGKIYLKSCARTYHCRLFLHILLLTNILDLNLKTTSTGDRQNNDQFAESRAQIWQGITTLLRVAFWIDKNCRYSKKCPIDQNRTTHLERKTSQVPYYKVLETHEHDTNNENSYLANCIWYMLYITIRSKTNK